MRRFAVIAVVALWVSQLHAAEPATPNVLVIPKCDRPPVIEGVIGTDEWSQRRSKRLAGDAPAACAAAIGWAVLLTTPYFSRSRGDEVSPLLPDVMLRQARENHTIGNRQRQFLQPKPGVEERGRAPNAQAILEIEVLAVIPGEEMASPMQP